MSSSRFSASYASLSRPPVGTTLYDRVYNDDLAYIKVQIMNMLNGDRLPNMPMGFPFRIVDDRCGGSPVSRGPYEFQEHFCPSDHRGRTQSVTFSYSPSEEREELSWRITVPSRESSLNKNIPSAITIAQVTVDRAVMELQFGIQFMTDRLILLQCLSRSIELGVLITIKVAKIQMFHPTDQALNCNPGDVIFVATDNNRMSHLVRVVKLQV